MNTMNNLTTFESKQKEVRKMKGMKGMILLVAMVAAIALLGAGAALADVISNSKHNLSSTGTGTVKASSSAVQGGEICIWCHTPHFANISMLPAPLWNKGNATATYTMYGTTIAGTVSSTTPVGVTKACLSCHDGVNAVNSLVNQAGAGGVTAIGVNVAFLNATSGIGYPITGASTNIGITLTGDHPVSIVYNAGTAGLRPTGTSINWIGATTIANLLRGSNIECSGCHAVHDNANTLFLRVSNSGSALCIGCHLK